MSLASIATDNENHTENKRKIRSIINRVAKSQRNQSSADIRTYKALIGKKKTNPIRMDRSGRARLSKKYQREIIRKAESSIEKPSKYLNVPYLFILLFRKLELNYVNKLF